MEEIKFDYDRCVRCGKCASRCPFQLIGQNEDGTPYFRAGATPCMGCAHCAASCPVGAVTNADAACVDLPPEANLAERMKTRRSCRSYEDRPVPRALIAEAIDVARYAPSAKNAQYVEWAVIDDARAIRSLGLALLAAGKADLKTAERYSRVPDGVDPIFWGAKALVLVHGNPASAVWEGDGIVAATAFDYAANALSLGTCWSGTAFRAGERLKKIAGIPEGHALYAAIMVGYPTERYPRLPGRKAARIIWK